MWRKIIKCREILNLELRIRTLKLVRFVQNNLLLNVEMLKINHFLIVKQFFTRLTNPEAAAEAEVADLVAAAGADSSYVAFSTAAASSSEFSTTKPLSGPAL